MLVTGLQRETEKTYLHAILDAWWKGTAVSLTAGTGALPPYAVHVPHGESYAAIFLQRGGQWVPLSSTNCAPFVNALHERVQRTDVISDVRPGTHLEYLLAASCEPAVLSKAK